MRDRRARAYRRGSDQRRTILVASPSPSLRHILAELLDDAGNRVLAIDAAPALIAHLRDSSRIDLVITDTRIGGMPGWHVMAAWEVVQEVKARRPGTLILQLIDSRADAVANLGSPENPVTVLQKPVLVTELLEIVKWLCVPPAQPPSPRLVR